ncbi:hypothetical protein LMG28727_03105 [Paraburkholderia kirstenboschensis]|nr:hypothetical protein LMG28727_03105 [Paraburkholderia kirstenboschensis]
MIFARHPVVSHGHSSAWGLDLRLAFFLRFRANQWFAPLKIREARVSPRWFAHFRVFFRPSVRHRLTCGPLSRARRLHIAALFAATRTSTRPVAWRDQQTLVLEQTHTSTDVQQLSPLRRRQFPPLTTSEKRLAADRCQETKGPKASAIRPFTAGKSCCFLSLCRCAVYIARDAVRHLRSPTCPPILPIPSPIQHGHRPARRAKRPPARRPLHLTTTFRTPTPPSPLRTTTFRPGRTITDRPRPPAKAILQNLRAALLRRV